MTTRKRHRWFDNRCLDCGMSRRLEEARSQRGCYGYKTFMRMVYRSSVGRQVYVHSKPNAVPPCLPPRKVSP